MTISKSQGQSLAHVGYLPNPVFSHDQLYDTFSRVTYKKVLKVLTLDEEEKPIDTTINVLYKEALTKISKVIQYLLELIISTNLLSSLTNLLIMF